MSEPVSFRTRRDGLAGGYGIGTVGYYVEASAPECLLRNEMREGKARAPSVASYATAKKLPGM